jgi:uncharacterized protein YgbK (DUF1537 family)
LPIHCTSDEPGRIADMQERHGRKAIAAAVEGLMAELAREAVARCVRRLIVGGRTFG